MNQLVRIDYQDGTFDAYTYDVAGNRLSATNEQGTDYYYYDALNRLTREEQSNGAVLTYVYDAAGNRTEVTLTYQGNSYTTRYRYDALNRLQQVEDNAGGQTLYTYDAVGNRGSVTYPNGNVGTYAYDSRNRLTALETQNNAQAVLQAYTYTLDATGRRIQIDESSGRHTVYHYDDLYRLTSESITDAVNGNYLAEYQYDNVGNRTQSVIDSQTTQYDYDANDRLLQQGNVIYTYDQNGNTLSENDNGLTKAYTYNDRNKLVGLTQPDTSQIRYYYNANGIRTGKTESGLSTAYVVDQNRDYSQVLLENTGSDEILYTYGDDLLSRSRGSDSAYYHYDGLGSTRALSDATGSLTDTWDYSAFGGSLNRTGSTENSYLFTGEQFDTSLNQYYLRARYYDQSVGRFTQMDSWNGNSQDPITLHKYLYAKANPAYYTDPTGHFSSIDAFGSMSIAGALAVTAVGSYQIGQSLSGSGTIDSGFSNTQLGWLVLASMAVSNPKIYELITEKVNKRNDTTVDYYRAVDTEEMIDILDCNCFRFPDYGFGIEPTSVKRFWLAQSSAITFGNSFLLGDYAGAGNKSFFVVKATISQTADNTITAQSGGTNPGDEFIGLGRAVGLGLLPLLNFEAQRNGGIQMVGEY